MSTTIMKWQLRAAYIKVAIGFALLAGLIVGYFTDTTRPPSFYYVPLAVVTFAVLFWVIKLVLLLRDQKAP